MSKLKYFDGTNWNEVNGQITGDTLPIGAIIPYGSTTVPTNWLICDGSAVSRTTYAELFAVIGTSYGAGDGSTTFNLPDKKGRSSVGYNSADTDFNAIGKKGGSKELQKHSHSLIFNKITSSNTSGSVNGLDWHSNGADWGTNLTGETGTGTSGNLSPYEVDCWIIKAKQSAGLVANVSSTYSTSQSDTYSCDYINDCNSYSTSETFTGKYWIDGKPIYKKTIDCGALPNTDTKNVAHNITSFNKIINIYGYAYASSSQNSVPLPFSSPTNTLNVLVMAGTTNITILTGTDQSAFNESFITLEYTKNS